MFGKKKRRVSGCEAGEGQGVGEGEGEGGILGTRLEEMDDAARELQEFTEAFKVLPNSSLIAASSC